MKKIYQSPVLAIVSINTERVIAGSITRVSGADELNVGSSTSDLDKGAEANVKGVDWSDVWE